jgi:hypothetical protein
MVELEGWAPDNVPRKIRQSRLPAYNFMNVIRLEA